MILQAIGLPIATVWAKVRLWLEFALLAVCAFFLVVWRFDASALKCKEADLAKVEADLYVAHATIKQLQGGIQEQNAAIEQWKAQERLQVARVSMADAKAGTIRLDYEARTQEALLNQVPAGKGEALNWLLMEIQKAMPPTEGR